MRGRERLFLSSLGVADARIAKWQERRVHGQMRNFGSLSRNDRGGENKEKKNK